MRIDSPVLRSVSPLLSKQALSTSAPEKAHLGPQSINERVANAPIALGADVQIKIHMGDDERVFKGNQLNAIEFDFDAVEWQVL